MTPPKKLAFVLGDMTLTFTPDDILAVWEDYERENPGKKGRDIPREEFGKRCMARLKANAKLTRTVLHN